MKLKYFISYLSTKYKRLRCKNQQLRLILRAKEVYLRWIIASRNRNITIGLCYSFNIAAGQEGIVEPVYEVIPEYNPVYLNAKYKRPNPYWWPIKDATSRLDALDKLIELYKIRAKRID